MTKYTYTAEWSKNFQSSDYFRNRKYDVNIKPNLDSREFTSGPVRIGGGFQVDAKELREAFGCTQLRNLKDQTYYEIPAPAR